MATIDILSICCEIAFMWMPPFLNGDWTTTAQEWLGVGRQQAITWNAIGLDLFRHIASPGQNELKDMGKITLQHTTIKHSNAQFAHIVFLHLLYNTKNNYFELKLSNFTLLVYSKMHTRVNRKKMSDIQLY